MQANNHSAIGLDKDNITNLTMQYDECTIPMWNAVMHV